MRTNIERKLRNLVFAIDMGVSLPCASHSMTAELLLEETDTLTSH